MDLITLALAKSYVDKKINEEGIVTGATPQQAAQIEQNKTDIADLQVEIEGKQPKGDYVKTVNGNKPDANGNVVVATGGNGSGENVKIDTSLTMSGAAADAAIVGQRFSTLHEAVAALGGNVTTVEPADGDIPKVFITGVIPTTKDEVEAEMWYISKSLTFHVYLIIKCQGRSSMAYDKKNFTIKMYSDAARTQKFKFAFKRWGKATHKFVLKANYIDATHARNIIAARLWGEIVKTRPDYDTLPEEIRTAPNGCAIDGFPIKVYTNGTYQGLYTWNIGKDDWMWGMDEDNPNHILLCGETNTNGVYAENACNFRALWSGTDGNDWSVEVGTNGAEVKTSFNNLIGFVINNDGEAFRNGIGAYLDIQSGIDYYILVYVICALDNLGTNTLVGTYDLIKWYFGPYDLDSTFGNWYNGNSFVSPEYRCPEDYQEPFNLLFERIEANFRDELRARAEELLGSVLSYHNIVLHFERFMDAIGLDLYNEDATIYPLPNAKNKTIQQLRNFMRDRLTYVTGEFNAMRDPVPCTGITLSESEMVFDGTGMRVLTATVEPADTTDAVVWASDNEEVATVINGGVVSALANGSATITATCGNYSATCTVTVSGVEDIQPLYAFENGSYSAKVFNTSTQTYTTSENGHVSLESDAGAVATGILTKITKSAAGESHNEPIFTIPAGATVRMAVHNLTMDKPVTAAVFLSNTATSEIKVLPNVNNENTDYEATKVFDAETPVNSVKLWTSNVGEAFTLSFDFELYVNDERWI